MTQTAQILAAVLFAIAIFHTFSTNAIRAFAKRAQAGTYRSNFLYLLGEVEVVFGFWAAVFVFGLAALDGPDRAIQYVESVDFTEAVFVFAIMAVAGTPAVQSFASRGIHAGAKLVGKSVPVVGPARAFYLIALILGPLLGSLITEPAAMTVCALLLRERFFEANVSERFKYKTLALLFVNVSIGGLLTHFAAPPVVMVAKVWHWDTPYLFFHFGWKAALAVLVNTLLTVRFLGPEFAALDRVSAAPAKRKPISIPSMFIHLAFLALLVFVGHHVASVIAVFFLFLGYTMITALDEDRLQIREALLVGFFLAGLVVLGRPQSWWLTPILTSFSEVPLYLGATILTAFTDNAALTYLGAQVQTLSDPLKYALVAGAVTGGGLTVIANAPNPAGYGLLKDSFGASGIQAGRLFVAALIPTAIASFFLGIL